MRLAKLNIHVAIAIRLFVDKRTTVSQRIKTTIYCTRFLNFKTIYCGLIS
ncbi:hypothetical protein SDC9_121458 [bioreactor metagenome]|uniref:Uncharacterized protein n=1 Tax=bioreactor metagenome TaxID=1076179 RepID=A0A645CC17_9ZZZZ